MNNDSDGGTRNTRTRIGIHGYVLPAVVTVAVLLLSRIAFAACPAGMVQVTDQYCIDRYEASLDAQSWAISIPGVFPKVSITMNEASAACALAGKRLCTSVEWLRACKGPGNFTYPYGNTLQPKRCNDEGPQSATATTGAYSGCVTTEGAYDMVGNVNEWTADATGTFRGGYYGDIAVNGAGCNYVVTAHDARFFSPYLGFRCCAESDGTSVATLSCSGFESPMNQLVSVKHKNRVLPLKMQLLDAAGILVTSAGIQAPPVLEIAFSGGAPAAIPDDTYLPAGQGDEGNTFTYSDNVWQFNVQTKNFSGVGTYTIRAISGNPNEYVINPKCQATFVITQ